MLATIKDYLHWRARSKSQGSQFTLRRSPLNSWTAGPHRKLSRHFDDLAIHQEQGNGWLGNTTNLIQLFSLSFLQTINRRYEEDMDVSSKYKFE